MTPSPDSNIPAYHVYVMRIWQEQTATPVWRFSLEDPATGQRRGFACLSELTAYLESSLSPDVSVQKQIKRSISPKE